MAFDDTSFPHQPRILVIDDDADMRDVLVRSLSEIGEILCESDGEEGISRARALIPDLIVLDVQMPGFDGFDVIDVIKRDSTIRHVPVIFVTGDFIPELESHCLEAGAADYIAKPVNLRVLQARVRTHLLLKFQSDALSQLAFRDGLTGVFNRRAFDDTLEAECARARRAERPLSLIMVDVDHFKLYNDTYGHLAGDEVLRAVTGAIAKVAGRAGDIVGRFGGEEFGILLPNTDADAAAALAERIVERVRALDIRHAADGAGVIVTISAGVSTSSGAMRPDDLIAAADAELYRAKDSGRDRACAVL